MEVTKLFRVFLVLISFLFITQCGVPTKKVSHQKVLLDKNYMSPPKFKSTDAQYQFMRWGFNEMQYLDFRFWNLTGFNKQEKNQHKDAVYIALNNAEDFEIVSWYSTTREASGKIRVIFTHPINAGYCRDYQVQLQIKKRVRSKTLTACKTINSPSWSFHYYELPEDNKFFN